MLDPTDVRDKTSMKNPRSLLRLKTYARRAEKTHRNEFNVSTSRLPGAVWVLTRSRDELNHYECERRLFKHRTAADINNHPWLCTAINQPLILVRHRYRVREDRNCIPYPRGMVQTEPTASHRGPSKSTCSRRTRGTLQSTWRSRSMPLPCQM